MPQLYLRLFSLKIWLFTATIGANLAIAQSGPLVILSKSYGNQSYENWLKRVAPEIRIVSLYHVSKDSVDYWLKQSDGILLSGGEDIFPGRYGQTADTSLCESFDLRRDSLEWTILNHAFSYKKPTFGICRGLQMINVYLKGSLYPDVPSVLGPKVRHREDGPTYHEVVLDPSDWRKSCGTRGKVASNHHQGINRLGTNLKPLARSDDGLIEAIEGDQNAKMPFLMAVQWHPERMPENDPLSKPLAQAFAKAVKSAHKAKWQKQ